MFSAPNMVADDFYVIQSFNLLCWVNEECTKGGQFLINSAQKCKSKLEIFMSA